MVSPLFLCSPVLSRGYQCLSEGFMGGHLTRCPHCSYDGALSSLPALVAEVAYGAERIV